MGAAQDAEHDARGVFPGFVFNGDREAARLQIPFAQQVLHQLRGFVATSGTKVFSMTRRFDGGFVRASVNNGIESIYVFADSNSKVVQRDIDRVEILSGVTKGGEIVTITPPVIGATPYDVLRSYKPTQQAYKYPLKKHAGSDPTAFNDEERLVIEEFGLSTRLMDYGNFTYNGSLDKANLKISEAEAFLADCHAESIPTGAYFEKYSTFSEGYIRVSGIKGTDNADRVHIFAEGTTSESPRRSQYAKVCPSMYSGLMAKAVQVIMGYGKLKPKDFALTNKTVDVKLKYDWRWARCHGIVRGADKALWLVEISVHNGIIAMPLPMFVNTVKGTPLYSELIKSDQDVLREATKLFGGLPSGGTFPPAVLPVDAPSGSITLAEAITKGEVIRLATPEYMEPYFSKHSYSSSIGWSFSIGSGATATEAHNTCCTITECGTDAFSVPPKYYYLECALKSFHFKLTFNIGGKVKIREENQPIASGSSVLTDLSEVEDYSAVDSILSFSDEGLIDDANSANSKYITLAVINGTVAFGHVTTPLFVCYIADSLETIFIQVARSADSLDAPFLRTTRSHTLRWDEELTGDLPYWPGFHPEADPSVNRPVFTGARDSYQFAPAITAVSFGGTPVVMVYTPTLDVVKTKVVLPDGTVAEVSEGLSASDRTYGNQPISVFCSMFGEQANAMFGFFYSGASVTYNRPMVGYGPMLSAETAPANTPFSFLGYVA